MNLLDDPAYFHCDPLRATFKKVFCVYLQEKAIRELSEKSLYSSSIDFELKYSCCKNCELGKQNRKELKIKKAEAKKTETTKPENKEAEMNKPETTEKMCRKCNQIKDKEKDFHKHRGSADGYNRLCKDCRSNYQRYLRKRKQQTENMAKQQIERPFYPSDNTPETTLPAAPATHAGIAAFLTDVAEAMTQMDKETGTEQDDSVFLHWAYQASLELTMRLWKMTNA